MLNLIQENNDSVTRNKALVTAYGYFYAPIPSFPQYDDPIPHYDRDHMVFYWLLKAESGL